MMIPHRLMRSTSTRTRLKWFETTQWSIVRNACASDGSRSRLALEQLCEKYWLPVYSYVRRKGYKVEDCQDLTQEFFARLVADNRIAKADQQKGRFRSFLLTSLNYFLSDEWDKSRALKRGGGIRNLSLHFDTGEALYELEPVENMTPEQIYERRWALTLLETVLNRLRSEYDSGGKADLFQALTPCLVGERVNQPYSELASTLGSTESAVKSTVYRLRRRYRELLRTEIGNTVTCPEEVDDELRYLFSVLART
jgi:RNA polymerase sigma factor (sigma-70 family)